MTSPLDFEPAGPADPARSRSAAIIDFSGALLLAVLAFPFPIARAILPLPVFVAAILATIVVTHVLYLTLFALAWRRTPGMYLLELGLAGKTPAFRDAFVWAACSSLAFWPLVFRSETGHPSRGLPARLSGLETVASRSR